jgi:hypothetical protein
LRVTWLETSKVLYVPLVSPARVVTMAPRAGWLFQTMALSFHVVAVWLSVNVTVEPALDCEYTFRAAVTPIAFVGMAVGTL